MNMKKSPIYQQIKTLSIFALLSFGVIVVALIFQTLFSYGNNATGVPKNNSSKKTSTVIPIDPFKNLSLEARAVYVFDLSTNKVLYARDENEKLPLASLTKLMTALVALDGMNSDSLVTLTKKDISAEGDSGLLSGEKWRLGDLLKTMLVASSNDAAHAVSRFVGSMGQNDLEDEGMTRFVGMMNEKAQMLGLSSMEFFNESGLDVGDGEIKNGIPFVSTKAGGYGSAKDVELLIKYLWQKYPSTLQITMYQNAKITSDNGIIHDVPNTNEALGRFPGMIASKTGYTTLAGGNLAIIFDTGIGHPVIAVVLGSSYHGRFSDMQTLTEATLQSINPVTQ
ncbi:MAG: serine hydrolase [Candidatus Pacebacteria bacterium]|nr:serine hydrolase [Candidatus Paceibacterota bacterium]